MWQFLPNLCIKYSEICFIQINKDVMVMFLYQNIFFSHLILDLKRKKYAAYLQVPFFRFIIIFRFRLPTKLEGSKGREFALDLKHVPHPPIAHDFRKSLFFFSGKKEKRRKHGALNRRARIFPFRFSRYRP